MLLLRQARLTLPQAQLLKSLNVLSSLSSPPKKTIFKFQDVRDDVAGDKRGIFILTMNTKPMLSFLLLITLTLLVLLLLVTGWPCVALRTR
jgi:hypothetical protein